MEMTLYIPEILDQISSEKSRKKKQQLLIKHKDVKNFLKILKLSYDPNITPYYDKARIAGVLAAEHSPSVGDVGQTLSTLYMEMSKIDLLFGKNKFTQERLDLVMTQLRELVHPTEFDVILKMIKGDNLASGLTEKLVRETFPRLLSEEK